MYLYLFINIFFVFVYLFIVVPIGRTDGTKNQSRDFLNLKSTTQIQTNKISKSEFHIIFFTIYFAIENSTFVLTKFIYILAYFSCSSN